MTEMTEAPGGGRRAGPQETLLNPTERTRPRVRGPVPARVDVAVVGAGLGGLTAAARLARSGLRVAVFDPHYVAGGCATMFARGRPGQRFVFDVGLHYVGEAGEGGAVRRILDGLGADVSWCALDPDGYDVLHLPGLDFAVPCDPSAFRARLLEHFPSERRGIDRYLRLVEEVGHLAHRSGPGLILQAMLRGRLAAWVERETLSEFLTGCTRDPQLQAVLSGQNGIYGLPPSRASALMHAGLLWHYSQGAWYPRGGGQALADRLCEVIEAHGGTVHLRHRVTGIEVGPSGRVRGVRVHAPGGELELESPRVVSNADLAKTLLELLPAAHLPDRLRRRVQGYEWACGIFITFIGVRGNLADLGVGTRNHWQYDTLDMEEYYAPTQGPGLPRGAYFTSGSLKDAGSHNHASAGLQTLEIMAMAPPASAWAEAPTAPGAQSQYRKHPDYLEMKARFEGDLIQRAERLFPGLGERILFVESATPATHLRFTGATDGSAYGIAGTPSQMMRWRLGWRGPVPGLYLCGASLGSGHGIAGALRSGHAAAGALLQDRKG